MPFMCDIREDDDVYAVIFVSTRTKGDNGYSAAGAEMVEMASRQPGYLGIESVRDEKGNGITISYWKSLEAIKKWRENMAHSRAQSMGKEKWYESYALRISKIINSRYFLKDNMESPQQGERAGWAT